MCGRCTFHGSNDEIAEAFAVEASGLQPRYNFAPSQEVKEINTTDARRQLIRLRWELVPSWAKVPKLAPINAMDETVAAKPFFRSAVRQRRCLIPASGFYEWSQTGKKRHRTISG
jgi:putative SOS response-associated peptidase YedK